MSHVESELAVKLVWVAVLLLTVSPWVAGAVPLDIPVKDIVVAESFSDGWGLTM